MKQQNKIKVFIVDDDRMFLHSLKHFLSLTKNATLEIRSFPSGEECLQHLKENPEIVVLDYHLDSLYPYAMNGIQVLNRIKTISPETEVIILTSNNNAEIAIEHWNTGLIII